MGSSARGRVAAALHNRVCGPPEMASWHVTTALVIGGTVEQLLEAAQLKKVMPAVGRVVDGVRSGALGPCQLCRQDMP